MAIFTVALVGANGNLGAPILQALLGSGTFRITVLRRSSKSTIPTFDNQDYTVHTLASWTVGELQRALQGQDAVIACFPLKNLDDHIQLVEAAAAAGVKRFIPADFGSVDSRSQRARDLVPLFDRKVKVRERLEKLAAETPGFTWTSIVGGHFFDWGLKEGFLHFNLQTRTADILDDGTQISSLSTLARYSEAVVRVLHNEESTANKMLFIQSFAVSQHDILRSLERTTNSKWTVSYHQSEDFIEKHKAAAQAGDAEAIEDLVFALGVLEGNWQTKPEFAMSTLGLANENLDEIVLRVVGEFSSARDT